MEVPLLCARDIWLKCIRIARVCVCSIRITYYENIEDEWIQFYYVYGVCTAGCLNISIKSIRKKKINSIIYAIFSVWCSSLDIYVSNKNIQYIDRPRSMATVLNIHHHVQVYVLECIKSSDEILSKLNGQEWFWFCTCKFLVKKVWIKKYYRLELGSESTESGYWSRVKMYIP